MSGLLAEAEFGYVPGTGSRGLAAAAGSLQRLGPEDAVGDQSKSAPMAAISSKCHMASRVLSSQAY